MGVPARPHRLLCWQSVVVSQWVTPVLLQHQCPHLNLERLLTLTASSLLWEVAWFLRLPPLCCTQGPSTISSQLVVISAPAAMLHQWSKEHQAWVCLSNTLALQPWVSS